MGDQLPVPAPSLTTSPPTTGFSCLRLPDYHPAIDLLPSATIPSTTPHSLCQAVTAVRDSFLAFLTLPPHYQNAPGLIVWDIWGGHRHYPPSPWTWYIGSSHSSLPSASTLGPHSYHYSFSTTTPPLTTLHTLRCAHLLTMYTMPSRAVLPSRSLPGSACLLLHLCLCLLPLPFLLPLPLPHNRTPPPTLRTPLLEHAGACAATVAAPAPTTPASRGFCPYILALYRNATHANRTLSLDVQYGYGLRGASFRA